MRHVDGPSCSRHDEAHYPKKDDPSCKGLEATEIPYDLSAAADRVVSPILSEKCDDMQVAVCLATVSRPDLPIVFANSHFGEMTGWCSDEVIGKSSLFLKGTLTEQTLEDEISLAVQQNEDISFALINYRRNDALFFNLMSVRPLPVGCGEPLLMICQSEFTPARGMRPHLPLISALDATWRGVRNGVSRPSKSLTETDMYQLESLSIRFEAAFLRAQNAVIRKPSPEMLRRLAELAKMQTHQLLSSQNARIEQRSG